MSESILESEQLWARGNCASKDALGWCLATGQRWNGIQYSAELLVGLPFVYGPDNHHSRANVQWLRVEPVVPHVLICRTVERTAELDPELHANPLIYSMESYGAPENPLEA